jgi:hypothetical protein
MQYLMTLKLGALQQKDNLAVFPIFSAASEGIEYLTLPEALGAGIITITEVDQGGSVPELLVMNNGDVPVLLLDGEELIGAKQNRVLNTTILIRERSKTVVPVSCVEQGRWRHTSPTFAESRNVMSSRLRVDKNRSVSRSMEHLGLRMSDQNEVWSGVDRMAMSAGVSSPTGAMRDIYEERERDFSETLDSFSVLPDQKGMLLFINGKVAGLEALSRSRAFASVHQKLLRSYALDAMLERDAPKKKPTLAKARAFLESVKGCDERQYDGIGYGRELRLRSEHTVGSALVVEEAVVHISLLSTQGEDGSRRSHRKEDGVE